MKIRALVSIDKSSLPCSNNLFLRFYGHPWVSTAAADWLVTPAAFLYPGLLIGSLPSLPLPRGAGLITTWPPPSCHICFLLPSHVPFLGSGPASKTS